MDTLQTFAREHDIEGAELSGIGAFQDAVLAYWDAHRKEYEEHALDEHVEVTAFLGNISLLDHGPDRRVHVHAVLGRRDLTAVTGHLMDAHVYPTLEVFLTETPRIRREHDAEIKLPLLCPG